jgi:hypothetical protein
LIPTGRDQPPAEASTSTAKLPSTSISASEKAGDENVGDQKMEGADKKDGSAPENTLKKRKRAKKASGKAKENGGPATRSSVKSKGAKAPAS